MFDAEKLLGKVVQEFMGASGSKKKKGKKAKNSLLGSLTSGAGLMTAIGLGIGAYEILRDKQAASQQPQYAPPPPPPGNQTTAPPPSSPNVPQTAYAPPPPPPGFQPQAAQQLEQEVAVRMIQVMVAAAHADGTMDSVEEARILERAAKAGLSPEEKQFLLLELHNPKNIAELTVGVNDPALAKALYMAAVASIDIDTDEERAWLDELGGALQLSKAVQSFIEDGQ